MGSVVQRIVVVFVNKSLTINGVDWPMQMIEISNNNKIYKRKTKKQKAVARQLRLM